MVVVSLLLDESQLVESVLVRLGVEPIPWSVVNELCQRGDPLDDDRGRGSRSRRKRDRGSQISVWVEDDCVCSLDRVVDSYYEMVALNKGVRELKDSLDSISFIR